MCVLPVCMSQSGVIKEHTEEHKDFRFSFSIHLHLEHHFLWPATTKFGFHKPKFCKFWHHYRYTATGMVHSIAATLSLVLTELLHVHNQKSCSDVNVS
jgi:hypothetical protein